MGLICRLGFMPRASLEIDTGQPVMRPGSSVTLQIENEDGLQGWLCWVYKGGRTRRIKLRLSNDTVRLPFSPNRLMDRETIFWCTDKDRQQRSNQIIVLTSGTDMQQDIFGLMDLTHFLSYIKSAMRGPLSPPDGKAKNDGTMIIYLF